ncbi:MAG: hypothetical protein C0446_13595 [Chitinophaga sp.]|nr:hypothetical protein [Chitinophaga sp.]
MKKKIINSNDMQKTKLFFISIFLLGFVFNTNSQVPQNINMSINLPKMTPVSPEAASLGKYGQIPVSYYTGVPNISIPLYNIKTGDIQMPISVSYHSSGIKVDEMSSSIGLGWALNAGGVVTRSQRGLDDEVSFINNGVDKARRLYNNLMSTTEKNQYLLEIYRKQVDSEADIFYFNVGGISGKFFYTEQGNFVTIPRSDIKVTFSSNTWFITTDQGIKYTFAETEITQSEPYCWSSTSPSTNNDVFSSTSAWYLSSVEDKNGNIITFSYEGVPINYKTKVSATRNLLVGGLPTLPDFSYCNTVVNINSKILKTINFSNGKIVFNHSTVNPLTALYPLSSILITDYSDVIIKKFQFYTSYFNTSGIGGCEEVISSRLRLDSIKEGSNDNKYLPPFKFTYDNTPLPCRLSNAQDHWGYYNGRNNNTFVRYRNSLGGAYVGANKEPDSSFTKAGILTKINYPTGGLSEFKYEQNISGISMPAGFNTNNPISVTNLNGDNYANGGNYAVYYNSSFTVQSSDCDPSGLASFNSTFSYSVDNISYFHLVYATIIGPNNFSYQINTSNLQSLNTLQLTPGIYFIYVTLETEYPGTPFLQFSWGISKNPYENTLNINKLHGGLRIRSVINKDNIGTDDVLIFDYNRHDLVGSNSLSSGVFALQPNYEYEQIVDARWSVGIGSYRIYNSTSQYPLLQTNGSAIGYTNVTVFHGLNGENGKKELTYTSYNDYGDIYDLSMPFPSATEYDWKRGLLTKEVTYKKNWNAFLPIQKKEYDYEFHNSDTSTRKFVSSIKIGKEYVFTPYSSDAADLAGIVYAGSQIVTEAFNIRREKIYNYDQFNGNLTHLAQSEFNYNSKNFQERRRSVNTSKGDSLINYTSYPIDYNATNALASGKFIYDLSNKNIISVPIEQITTRKTGNSEKVVTASINAYKSDNFSKDVIYRLNTQVPIDYASFSKSSLNNSNQFIFNSNYSPEIIFDQYYFNGKLAQAHKVGDNAQSYLFGYTGELVIAEVNNASYQSIAYTSFEETGTGNWLYNSNGVNSLDAITGKKSYQLANGTVSKTGLLNSNKYILSFWSKNGSCTVQGGTLIKSGISTGNWTYYEYEVTGVSATSISGNGAIDEIRFYPKGSEMKSYTYEPLLGISSASGINGRIVFYEYDSFGRLSIIRDHDKNILKKLCYNYAGQEIACDN